MTTSNEDINIMPPRTQLSLFGYKDYFDTFVKLAQKKKIPNCILLSGPKGLGKSTFAHHIINYLLSKDEDNNYDINKHKICNENLSYKLLCANTHPNFFSLENNQLEKNIKIEHVRNLLNFLGKSTYSKNLKIILIDNVEYLNLNSSNALLKSIEEPKNNTIFFIIHNSFIKILDSIKSRCSEFKLFFTYSEKKTIFKKIIQNYKCEKDLNESFDNLYYDTPGNVLKHYFFLNKKNANTDKDSLENIFCLLEKYGNDKNYETLFFLSFFIEKHYLNLCKKNRNNLNKIFFDYSKILNQINSIQKYNLNEKSVFISIKNILTNEAK